MTIIVLLAAIATGVYFKFIDVQQGNNSNTQISKIHDVLVKRWNAEVKAARDDARAGKIPASVTSLAGGDTRRAEVIYVKLRLRRAFPMSFAEILNLPFNPTMFPDVVSPLPSAPEFTSYLKQNGITTAALAPQDCESAVCLLLALQRGTGGGGVDAEDLGGAASADLPYKISATVTVQLKGLVDGFGSPLAFSRWPTGSTELNPSGPQANLNDPGDPEGTLTEVTWLNAPIPTWPNPPPGGTSKARMRQAFEILCHQLPNRASASAPPQSYKLSPMIASPGPDKNLGLDKRTFTPLAGTAANDNVYSTSVP
jgi:hypothetical protein